MCYTKDESFINKRIEEQKEELDSIQTRFNDDEFNYHRFVELTHSAEVQLEYFLDLQKQLNN